MEKIKFYNGFGITPTNTHLSAGSDFYVPNINDGDPCAKEALKSFEKSYNKSQLDVLTTFGFLKDNIDPALFTNNAANIIHLYYALQSYVIEGILIQGTEEDAVKYFVKEYLVFDEDKTPGIKLQCNDHLFINSGIKVALHENECGLYVNKSGMGNKGIDVRACLVDEDYAGYVHLSVAYTKRTHKDMIIYCGDKLTQMMIFEIKHYEWEETNEESYNNIMRDSKRGDAGFGSSDVKH